MPTPNLFCLAAATTAELLVSCAGGSATAAELPDSVALTVGDLAAGISIALQPLQFGAHLRRMLIPQIAIFLQRSVDNSFQFRRHVGIQPRSRCRRAIQHRVKDDPRSISPERQDPRRPSRRAPRQTRTDRFAHPDLCPATCSGDIYATVPSAVPGLVKWGSSAVPSSCWPRQSGSRVPACTRNLGQPKVQNLGMSALGHKNVRGLDIAMNHSLGVRGIQRVGNLDGQRQNQFCFQRTPGDTVLQGTPSRNSMAIKDWSPCWCRFRGWCRYWDGSARTQHAPRAESAPKPAGLGPNFSGKKFKGDEAAKLGVLGLIDHAHPSAAELLNDPVVRDGLADHLGQILPKARVPTDFLTLLAHLQWLPRRVTIRARSVMLLPLSGDMSCKAIGDGIAFHWRKHCQGSFAACCFAFESHDERNQIIGVSGSILGIERQQLLRYLSAR